MNTLRNEKGAVHILLALMMTVLMGAAALVVDVGLAAAEKTQLSNGLDAAALAGGQELPASAARARAVAEQYLQANGIALSQATITISPDQRQISLVGSRTVNNTFAKALGVPTTTVRASAAVKVGAASTATGGVRPLAIPDQTLTYGQTVVLKESSGGGTVGNYGGVSFGPSGA